MLSYGEYNDLSFAGESFSVPGQECSVATIEASGGDTWKKFCDCAFIEQVTEFHVFVNGSYAPKPILGMTDEDWAAVLTANLAANGTPASAIRVDAVEVQRKPLEWEKCLSKHCTLLTGCWNGSKEGWDGFNVHPGMYGAPWTEMGAAARGIDKRNKGFWYAVGAATSFSLGDFYPPKLLVIKLTNYPKYLLIKIAANYFPGTGVLLNIEGALEAAAWPLALAAGPTYFEKEFLKPMIKANLRLVRTMLALFGGGTPAVLAMCAQEAAQQLLEDQSISLPPEVWGIIKAIAKDAPKIKNMFDPSQWMSPSTWKDLGSVIEDVAALLGEGVPKAVIGTIGHAIWVGAGIIEVLQKSGPEAAADFACMTLLGFSTIGLEVAVKQGVQSAKNAVAVAKANVGSLKNAQDFQSIIQALQGVVQALGKIEFAGIGQQLGQMFSGLSGVVTKLNGAAQMAHDIETTPDPGAPGKGGLAPASGGMVVASSRAAVSSAPVAMPASPPPATKAPASQIKVVRDEPAATAPAAIVGAGRTAKAAVVVGGKLAVVPSEAPAAAPPGGGAALVFAALGFAFGGPVGAAVGAGVGVFAGRK